MFQVAVGRKRAGGGGVAEQCRGSQLLGTAVDTCAQLPKVGAGLGRGGGGSELVMVWVWRERLIPPCPFVL